MKGQQFAWAATRLISVVDVDGNRSNQHELGGCAVLHEFLVDDGRLDPLADSTVLSATMVAVGHGDEPLLAESPLTLYDTRRNDLSRSPEWRLYYPSGSDIEDLLRSVARPGDRLTYAVPTEPGPDLVLLVVAAGSGWEGSLQRVFPVDVTEKLTRISPLALAANQAATQMHLMLDDLGLTPSSDENILDWVLGQPEIPADIDIASFPSTATMAALAFRRCVGEVETQTADERLLHRLDAESELFYALEEHLALDVFEGCETVADYVSIAKSLLQRRRARRGRSFELHLARVFEEESVPFEAQVLMPDGERVDFLFPSLDQYNQPQVDPRSLFVANAKTTARERWRQLAQEAPIIELKHLITVDPNLSDAVVLDMNSRGVVPVIPQPLREVCPPLVVNGSLSLGEFVNAVRETV